MPRGELDGLSLRPLLDGIDAPLREGLLGGSPAYGVERLAWTTLDRRLVLELVEGGPRALLFDRRTDPAERHDVAAEHPDVVVAFRSALEARRRSLVVRRGSLQDLDPADEERLRAIGYFGMPK